MKESISLWHILATLPRKLRQVGGLAWLSLKLWLRKYV